jgi:hypothetical protein
MLVIDETKGLSLRNNGLKASRNLPECFERDLWNKIPRVNKELPKHSTCKRLDGLETLGYYRLIMPHNLPGHCTCASFTSLHLETKILQTIISATDSLSPEPSHIKGRFTWGPKFQVPSLTHVASLNVEAKSQLFNFQKSLIYMVNYH